MLHRTNMVGLALVGTAPTPREDASGRAGFNRKPFQGRPKQKNSGIATARALGAAAMPASRGIKSGAVALVRCLLGSARIASATGLLRGAGVASPAGLLRGARIASPAGLLRSTWIASAASLLGGASGNADEAVSRLRDRRWICKAVALARRCLRCRQGRAGGNRCPQYDRHEAARK